MDWREEIEAEFPPPRGGEPAGLRRDIADELADHLACATERELGKTGDAATARRAALARFGNPAALARRLWLEAMKERIMRDRIVMAGMIVLTLASLVTVGIVWRSMDRIQITNEALVATMQRMSEAQEAQTALIARDASGVLEVKATNWDVVTRKDTGPAAGVAISAREWNGNGAEEGKSYSVTTDREGIARIDPLPAGNYRLWAESRTRDIAMPGQNFVIGNAQKKTLDLHVPDAGETTASLDVNIEWPTDLQDKRIWTSLEIIGRTGKGNQWYQTQKIHLFFDPDGGQHIFQGDPRQYSLAARVDYYDPSTLSDSEHKLRRRPMALALGPASRIPWRPIDYDCDSGVGFWIRADGDGPTPNSGGSVEGEFYYLGKMRHSEWGTAGHAIPFQLSLGKTNHVTLKWDEQLLSVLRKQLKDLNAN